MKTASSVAENLKNLVQTSLGKELADIVLVADWVNLPEKQLHAALLGRIGVCASCWPDFLESHANASTHQDLPEQP